MPENNNGTYINVETRNNNTTLTAVKIKATSNTA